MASASRDETVRVWDATTGALRQTLEAPLGSVESVAFSADGQLLVTSSDQTVRLCDTTTGDLQKTWSV